MSTLCKLLALLLVQVVCVLVVIAFMGAIKAEGWFGSSPSSLIDRDRIDATRSRHSPAVVKGARAADVGTRTAVAAAVGSRGGASSGGRNGTDDGSCTRTRKCCVTAGTLPPRPQHPDLEYAGGPDREGTRIVFLLGYPFTGTSATHFLLGTSRNVSTLTPRRPGLLGPGKEGWGLVGIKKRFGAKRRWDGKLDWLDWKDLAVRYGRLWDLSRPLLVENSPPEIQAPERLKAAFEPMYGKVRFLLLVRGDCTLRPGRKNFTSRAGGYRNVVEKFPRDTYVLRFEDLCLRWEETKRDLVRWEPLLADMNITAIPTDEKWGDPNNASGRRRRRLGEMLHKQTSVRSYCESKVDDWCDHHDRDLDPAANSWGYGNSTMCHKESKDQ